MIDDINKANQPLFDEVDRHSEILNKLLIAEDEDSDSQG